MQLNEQVDVVLTVFSVWCNVVRYGVVTAIVLFRDPKDYQLEKNN